MLGKVHEFIIIGRNRFCSKNVLSIFIKFYGILFMRNTFVLLMKILCFVSFIQYESWAWEYNFAAYYNQ